MTAPRVAPPPGDGSVGASAPLLVATELTRRFGSALAVRKASLILRAGERVALLGPNGAGKTTLIRMLATALRPTAGALFIGGVDAARSPSVPALRWARRLRTYSNGTVGRETAISAAYGSPGREFRSLACSCPSVTGGAPRITASVNVETLV